MAKPKDVPRGTFPAPDNPENAVLRAPDGVSSCGFGAQSFEVVDGFVEVPQAAVPSLLSHGFTAVD